MEVVVKSLDYEKIYHFLMTNFGADKIDVMIKLLGKPFIDWSISEKKNIDKLFECIGFKKVFLKPTDPQKNPVIRKAYVKK